jgi:hypothetical protein
MQGFKDAEDLASMESGARLRGSDSNEDKDAVAHRAGTRS